MKYLTRRDTRAARLLVLRIRIHALQRGDDYPELFLAALATIYALVMLAPGDTTGHAAGWDVLRRLSHGDIGLGITFAVLAVPLWLGALRLVGDMIRRVTLVVTFAVWVGMSVGFFAGYIWSLDPWLSILYAVTAWLAYLRTDRDTP